jgi:anti-sigma B factor antagonist
MSAGAAKISVLVGDRFVCVRIVGRANFASSLDFRTLGEELKQKGCRYFVLDLSECKLMDSTFLGVLAGFGLSMKGADGVASGGAVELLNPNPRVVELLESLGILDFFNVVHAAPDTGKAEAQECPSTEHSKVEVTLACLEAHRLLMQLNPENVSRFKDVAAFLAEDLKRLGAQP